MQNYPSTRNRIFVRGRSPLRGRLRSKTLVTVRFSCLLQNKITPRKENRNPYCWGTNYCTIWLKLTPKLRQNCTQKTRHPRRPKLAAARSAAANFVRRLCRVFCARQPGVISGNFQPNRAIICPSTVTLAGCIEIGWFLDRSAPFFTQIPNLASKSIFRKIVIFSRANAPARLLRSKTLVNAYFFVCVFLFHKNTQQLLNKGTQKRKLITLAGCIEISRNKSTFFGAVILHFSRIFTKKP